MNGLGARGTVEEDLDVLRLGKLEHGKKILNAIRVDNKGVTAVENLEQRLEFCIRFRSGTFSTTGLLELVKVRPASIENSTERTECSSSTHRRLTFENFERIVRRRRNRGIIDGRWIL